jgi:hypothetical protein
MQSPIANLRRPDVHLPEIDVSSVDLSNLSLPKVDGPTVEGIQAAVRDVATNVGLVERRRARWPFVVGAAVVAAGVGLAVMNSAALRERIERARASLMERIESMRSEESMRSDGRPEEPLAFTAAEPKPIEEPPYDMGSNPPTDDYPEGLGSQTEPQTGQSVTNGRSKVASSR